MELADDRVWVWLDGDYAIQHLASPPDDIEMRWTGATACELDGDLNRVSYENVDRGKSCQRCTARPYTLAGDDRGLP